MGVGGNVAVGEGKGAGVAVAGWQAVTMRRHPIKRNFFIVLIKTQSSGTLFQRTMFTACLTLNRSEFLSGNKSLPRSSHPR
jgi:hypothetical protein